jgi:hypothetical protein
MQQFDQDWLELGSRVARSLHYQHRRNLRLVQAAEAQGAADPVAEVQHRACDGRRRPRPGPRGARPVTSSTTMTGRGVRRSMLAFRSVMSALSSFVVRSFSTNSRPALRAAASGGRPRPAP